MKTQSGTFNSIVLLIALGLFTFGNTGCYMSVKVDGSDSSTPQVTVSSTLIQKTTATTIPITIELTKAIDLTAADISVTNATKGTLIKISDTRYTLDVTPIAEGTVVTEILGEKFSSIAAVARHEITFGAPPTFSGLKYTKQVSETEVLLNWDPATDNATTTNQITYDVCVSATASDCVNNFTASYTVTGLTSLLLNGLTGNEYNFVVRAKDALNFSEANTTESKSKKLTVSSLASTSYNTCAILSDTTVKCWGDNNYGILGVDPTVKSYSGRPLAIAGLTNVTQIASGKGYNNPYHTCFLISDGSVKCIGRNSNGQLGNGNTTSSHTVVDVAGLGGAASFVAVGTSHSCAIVSGQVKCWGLGTTGQLGQGANSSSLVPVTVSGITTATFVAASNSYTCAVLADTTVRCWGSNTDGQLGNNSTTNSNVPVVVSGLSNATKLALSYTASCALLSTGGINCWGEGSSGELGNGSLSQSNVPVTVSGIATATGLTAGGGYPAKFCALLSDQTAKCWGSNSRAGLGVGHVRDISLPEAVIGLSGATSIAMGTFSTCALLTDQRVKCWGSSEYGHGNGNGSNISNPVAVPNLSSVTNLNTNYYRTCAIKEDQSVHCWGPSDGPYGLLGSATSQILTTPTHFAALSTVTNMSQSTFHSCAILADKTIRCWGAGSSGQLGNGSSTLSNTPVTVSGISNAAKLASGRIHNCAMLDDGTVKCWGNNLNTLGNGSTSTSNTPVTVTGMTGIIDISGGSPGYWSGYDHMCLLKNDGTVWCWGENSNGQLGDGTTTDRTTPVQVSGITNAVKISATSGISCALLSDATVKCWGYNGAGGLGDGTTTSSSIPVTVSGLSSVIQISVGDAYACAVLSDNSVKCWGGNWWGTLGNISLSDQTAPVTVNLTKPVSSVITGDWHACAVHTDKTVSCWGSYSAGNLGNGMQTHTPSVFVVE